MDILHIINNINRGGAEMLLLKLIPVLKKKLNLKISVLILEDHQPLRKQFENLGIEIILVPVLHLSLVEQIFILTSAIRKIKPKIIHTHLLYSDTRGQIAGWLAGVKIRYITLHNMEIPTTPKSWMITKISAVLATKIIIVSDSIALFHKKTHLYNLKKMSTIYNAVSFEENNIDNCIHHNNKTLKIISVGRLQKQKGQKYLISAVNDIIQKGVNCELSIYGAGLLQEELQTQINELNQPQIVLRGETDNVKRAFEDADLFISASLWEGFNMALVEALTVGLPVIATNILPHQEILLKEGDYPLLISCESVKNIEDAIIKFMSLDYEILRLQCLKIAKHFTTELFVNNYSSLYRAGLKLDNK